MIIDELVAMLGWETKGEGDLARFNRGLDNVEKHARSVSKSMDVLTVAVGSFVGALASQAFARLADTLGSLPGDILKTSAEFEGFQTSLETIEGSSQKAAASMAWVQKFATETPYELAGVTDAFIKLKSYGLEPTDGTLKTLGDTASAMNKPLNQAVEAFADAATFQFERLREFGITSAQEGGNVTFRWNKNGKQLTKVVKKNSDDVRKFLISNFGDRFNGAMIKQSKTWNGLISNLGDTWTNFKKEIGDGGFFESMKSRLGGLLDYFGKLKDNGTLGKWAKSISDGLTTGVDETVNLVARLVRHFEYLSQWANMNPEIFSKITTGLKLLGAYIFPKGAAILILDDVLSYLEGHASVIGDFAKYLNELSGVDASTIGAVLTAVATAGAGFLLFGGTFATVAAGIRALAAALGLMGASAAGSGVGMLARLAGLSGALGALATRLSPYAAMFGLTSGSVPSADMPNGGKQTPEEAQQKQDAAVRSLQSNMRDRRIAGEWGDRRRQMDGLTKPAPGNIDDNTPGLSEKLGWLNGSNHKSWADALGNYRLNTDRMNSVPAPIVNDNSNRSVNVQPAVVHLTVEQITQAAAAAASSVGKAVGGALGGLETNRTPTRIHNTPSF